MFRTIFQVFEFEWRRSLTVGRMSLWFLLALIPVVLVGLVQWESQGNIPDEALTLITYVLVPQVSCMLGLLLWATPAIQSEMEAQTWIYITMRPQGRLAVLFGKYLVAVSWAASSGLMGSFAIGFILEQNPWSHAWTLARLVTISCVCYGALYLLIGVVVLKRSHIIAFVYSLVIEYGLSFVPATANKLTISYRLRGLLAEWMQLVELRTNADMVFSNDAASTHLVWLLLMVTAMLTIAAVILYYREIPLETEN